MTEKTAKNNSLTVSDKVIKTHMLFIAGVCLIFGIVNLVSGAAAAGVVTIAIGVIIPAIVMILNKKLSNQVKGTILSQGQLLAIIIISAAKHEMHGMFPLMLASMAIASVYYNLLNIKIHWVIMDIAVIGALFFKDFFYQGAGMEFLIKGIIGMNICATFIWYFIGQSIKYIDQSRTAEQKTSGLLEQMNEQVSGNKALMAKQGDVVARIAEISSSLDSTAALMEQISSSLSADAEEQEATIGNIAADIGNITEQAHLSLRESESASESARKSNETLCASNEEVRNMVNAMDDIAKASREIESIIKTIEDIAFQTNILALNASVEAARAGAAGKGFTVVADEVRNLAGKSAEAANRTSKLINQTTEAVAAGAALADSTAKALAEAVADTARVDENIGRISDTAREQSEFMDSVFQGINAISEVVSTTADTAQSGAASSEELSGQASMLSDLISEFKL